MASQLRQVLERFDDQTTAVSINRMAQEMDVTPGVLHGMIDYWVRKGKLREVTSSGEACTTCGVKSGCPFVIALPRYFERVLPGQDAQPDDPPCACGGGCGH